MLRLISKFSLSVGAATSNERFLLKKPAVEGILASKTIMARDMNKKDGDAVEAEASKRSRSETKNLKQLKPEPKIVKKSPNQGTKRKTEKTTNANRKNDKNKKEKDNALVKDQRDTGNKEKIDGMIFICNNKTKADCFRYNVMGLPQSKIDSVTTIKPGLKLFLYDFDAKLLYGIYEATSAGGMKLEPAAFNGSYSAQVRFKVHMDCLPLSEVTFKKAIMGNSGGDKIKFDTELTAQEVRKLTGLFQTSAYSPQQVQIPLVPLRRIIPAAEAALLPPPAEILGRCRKEIAPLQKETIPLDILSFGEKEYRMYGLRRPAIPAPALAPVPFVASDPSRGNRDPYDPYTPLTRAPYMSKMDGETDIPQRRMDESEYERQGQHPNIQQPKQHIITVILMVYQGVRLNMERGRLRLVYCIPPMQRMLCQITTGAISSPVKEKITGPSQYPPGTHLLVLHSKINEADFHHML